MSRRLLGLHLLGAGVTLAVIGPSLGHGLMLYDLGELLYFTDAVASGAAPGRDYAVNAYGPGRYVLLAGLFEVFGRSFATVWGLFLLLRLGITALAIELGRRFLSGPWVAGPALLLLLFPGPLHKGFYLLGSLVLLSVLLCYVEAPSSSRALGLGLVLGLVAAFRLDLGGFGVLLGVVAVLRARRPPGDFLRVLAPVAGGLALTFGALLASGEGVATGVVEQLLDDILKNQTIKEPRFPGPLELLRFDSLDPWLLWLPLPVYGLLGLRVVRGLRGRPPGDRSPELEEQLLLLGLGVLTCNQIAMKPEFGHFLQAAPLLWLASFLLLDQSWARSSWPLSRAAALGVAVALPTALLANTLTSHRDSIYTGSFTIPWERSERLETPLGPVSLNPGEHAALAPLLAELQQLPPGPLWVPTNQPLLYSLADREDVTGHLGVVYYADNPQRQELVIERLEAAQPPYAVFVDDSIEGPERTLGIAAPEVRAYLERSYSEHSRSGACEAGQPAGCFRLMLRREAPSGD